MSSTRSPRRQLVVAALWLSAISVVWGVGSGGVSVTVGVLDGSLAVLGLGLNVLADVTGSAVLIWRFRAELRQSGHPERVEARAVVIVAIALGTVSVALAAGAVHALATESHPETSVLGMVMAGLAVVVLSPLAYWKRRVGSELASRALRGDGTLSAIGAAIGLLALAGLVLERSFDWWWADRVAALIVAGIAGVEAARLSARSSSAAPPR